jgi:hypothetical protein
MTPLAPKMPIVFGTPKTGITKQPVQVMPKPVPKPVPKPLVTPKPIPMVAPKPIPSNVSPQQTPLTPLNVNQNLSGFQNPTSMPATFSGSINNPILDNVPPSGAFDPSMPQTFVGNTPQTTKSATPVPIAAAYKKGGHVKTSKTESKQSYTSEGGRINLGSGRVSTAQKNSKNKNW